MKYNKKFVSITMAIALTAVLLAGCSSNSSSTSASASTSASTTASETGGDSEMFTDRDKEIGYSESESTTIALSGSSATVSGEGATVSGGTVTITAEGTYILSGTLTGQIVVAADDAAKVQIVLNGVTITNAGSAAIYVKSADKVFITTASGSENTVTATGELTATDGTTKIDAAIFSKSDLTLNGAGTLTVNAENGNGVVSKDDLAVTCGTYNITSADHALNGKDSVRIADGTFNLTTTNGGDTIHASNDEDTAKGFVYIEGGSFKLSSDDDGIHASGALTICGGTIDITQSYEGIEGKNIVVSGGTISLVSSDDGFNASAGTSSNSQQGGMGGGMQQGDSSISLTISGGTITVDAGGDGLDSNGNLTITGGTTTVYGPTDNGNGALDSGEGCTISITGGTLMAAGSSGMAESFDTSSTQGSILYTLTDTQTAGTQVTLKDSSGNVLAQFTPAKTFNAVNLSAAGITSSGTYTLTVGSQSYTVTMSSISYSNKTGGMGGGKMGGQMPGGQMPQHGQQSTTNSGTTTQQSGSAAVQGANTQSSAAAAA